MLFGGSPLCVLRLSAAGAAAVDRWWRGEAVSADLAEGTLARRLLDAGLAHPEPPPIPTSPEVTVVVPVHDRPEELRRCLHALDRGVPVIVVDDCSCDSEAITAAAREAGADVVRLDPGRGPSAARNAGLRHVTTPLVAFVDSDCVLPRGFPGRLAEHLSDPALAVAAPRIVAFVEAPAGLLARYEAHHSALDMGPREGLIRAGSPIPYAPSAAIVARVEAVGSGFDESLSMGEDVDLLWRLVDRGWQVRYDPSVTVGHDHRVVWRRWFARRVAYNESNAPLLQRHPGRVPAMSISRGGATFWTALAVGAPPVAAVATLASVVSLGRILTRHLPNGPAIAVRLVLQRHVHEGRHLARALTGPWLPFLLAATLRSPRATRRVWIGVIAGAVCDWGEARREPTPLHYVVPRAAEDVARCIGVWRGCARERRFGALLPQFRHR